MVALLRAMAQKLGMGNAGKCLAMAHLVHITIRLQHYSIDGLRIINTRIFQLADEDEQIIWPRFEPHLKNGLMPGLIAADRITTDLI